MRKQITHISVHQTSKVIAAMHTVMLTVLLILPSVLSYLFHGKILSALSLFLLFPFFLWLLMYIGYVIACWFYNLIVPWLGGIEIDVSDSIEAEKIVSNPSEMIEKDQSIIPSERIDHH